jgi:hypothetical protein
VFIVWVNPDAAGEPSSIFACGIEVEEPQGGGVQVLDATATPIAGRVHAYDYQYGDLRVEIIAHHETDPHGEP